MIRTCIFFLLTLVGGSLQPVLPLTSPISKNVLNASALHPFGRFLMNKDHQLEMVGSAMHFGFTFEGTECRLFASIPEGKGHNYLQYEVDGVYQKRTRISGNPAEPIMLSAQTPGKHSVWIYKATEAHTGPIAITKIEGKNLKALKNPSWPLIEFIGNSITCGAAADASEIPCNIGEYHDHHNAYDAYGPRVARALHANFMLSSVSGIGVYRNWNSDGPTMPEVYEKTDFRDDHSEQWTFSRYSPKIVSIALGTNDFSNGDGIKKRLAFDSAKFTTSYIEFVRLVKSKYPGARIAILNSPVIAGKNSLLLQHCLEAIKQNIDQSFPASKPVELFFFQPMQPHGCSGHPSVEDHAVLASELVPFFKRML